ncbi:azurin [Capnocytophaga catalasegens]|uniref:Blue (type 1) copper domain-containing protein n=1 Tax=Capnocytophaga catalasegens TaxID=1004260 RepID=A0AAV5B0V4_9FLAO|nr:azurin [Capnocytophaga catalasegens]GIZ16546.1 hypothetical protein RCZ03_25460 [Capnocytophaga catalasegens]GJM51378.1 hypothetical protein RCZ15_23510 [Capnocytophaga catalasegens]GJM54282.1 hypothetical protein RCZ16_25980 [Capnocytophaga catalasegens]
MKKIVLLAVASAMIISCADKKKKEEQQAQEPVVEKQMEVVTPTDSNEVIIELGSTDQMTFDKTELRVKAGQKVKLVLKHLGTMKKEVMGHNFVLLKPGTDLATFAQAAMEAKDTNYIPKMTKDVIAYTQMIGGGETTSVTFDAPEKGTYDYICSFPGHYAMMKGKFIVE